MFNDLSRRAEVVAAGTSRREGRAPLFYLHEQVRQLPLLRLLPHPVHARSPDVSSPPLPVPSSCRSLSVTDESAPARPASFPLGRRAGRPAACVTGYLVMLCSTGGEAAGGIHTRFTQKTEMKARVRTGKPPRAVAPRRSREGVYGSCRNVGGVGGY